MSAVVGVSARARLCWLYAVSSPLLHRETSTKGKETLALLLLLLLMTRQKTSSLISSSRVVRLLPLRPFIQALLLLGPRHPLRSSGLFRALNRLLFFSVFIFIFISSSTGQPSHYAEAVIGLSIPLSALAKRPKRKDTGTSHPEAVRNRTWSLRPENGTDGHIGPTLSLFRSYGLALAGLGWAWRSAGLATGPKRTPLASARSGRSCHLTGLARTALLHIEDR